MVKTWPFDNPSNYTYDSNKIEVSGGIASLRYNLSDVLFWVHLNEATGATVIDSGPNNWNGTPIGDPISSVGKLSNCLRFDGSSQYVTFGNHCNFNPTDAFSIEFWYKYLGSNSNSGGHLVVSKAVQGDTYRGWYIMITNQVYFRFFNDLSHGIKVHGAVNNLQDGNWHHVVVTYDGSSNASGVQIYVDGTADTITIEADSLSSTDDTTNTVELQISGRQGTNFLVNGYVDEVVIYNKEMSSSWVSWRYNSGAGRETMKYWDDIPEIKVSSLFTPASISAWTQFVASLGSNNQGEIGFNLLKDGDLSTKYYWDGSNWVSGGDSDHFNSASTINDHIDSFDSNPDSIGFVAYFKSNGDQAVELDEVQVTYTANISPIVDAGANKSCYDEETIKPFSDCVFSDPDGSIEHAYYKIDGEVDTWTEIPIDSYATLLEAVQNFSYTFHNSGNIICRLQVEDNDGALNDDSLVVTVNKFTVTFHVKNSSTGEEIQQLVFTPGDGSSDVTLDSPFTWEYEKGNYVCGFKKCSYYLGKEVHITVEQDSTVIIELGNPLTYQDIGAIADAVWDESTSEHSNAGSFGENFQTMLSLIRRTLGLTQENFKLTDCVYDDSHHLLSATIKIYPSANDLDNDQNELATYSIETDYDSNGNISSYKVKKS